MVVQQLSFPSNQRPWRKTQIKNLREKDIITWISEFSISSSLEHIEISDSDLMQYLSSKNIQQNGWVGLKKYSEWLVICLSNGFIRFFQLLLSASTSPNLYALTNRVYT